MASSLKTLDPRTLALAKAHQRIAHDSDGINCIPDWDGLTPAEQDTCVREASNWLRAAVEAGIAPITDRPTDKHAAVWLDDGGGLWGEYQTIPSSDGDAILPLVWASEVCSSKYDLEFDHGLTFRLIGWSE